MIGRIHSFQTLGTVDGPGVRFVVFMQGCNLRCGCCHNPDTWSGEGGREAEAAALADRVARYREYFGAEGGITVSGGEPLLQAAFVAELFRECHARGINTCLDTSGDLLNREVEELLAVTDRVLLDIKYATDAQYRAYVGCGIDAPLAFLARLDERHIPTTLRQVTVPTLNDNAESMAHLADLRRRHSCVDGVELLPFKKVCKVKYDSLGITFPFEKYDTPTADRMAALRKMLEN
ncbi:MAG: pyruvate formate lyase-activating protein [Clostridia bacterium]|nr:pyruvate formate lyase-activating protein [Clostridia bacterium]